MYGIGGEQDLTEQTLDHLPGYAGARPVRIGNAAYDQQQHDVWGALLDSVYLHTKSRDHLRRAASGRSSSSRSRRRSSTGASPTRDLGGARASRSTSPRPRSCAGSRPTAAPGWRGCAASTARPPTLADGGRRDQGRHLRQRGRRARRVHPVLRHHRARRLAAADAARRASCRRTTRGSARRCCAIARRAHRATAWCCATGSRRPTTAFAARRARFTICSFWLVSALVRDRRGHAGRASSARSCSRFAEPAASSTPRRSTRTAAATWATSRRPSPTSR